MISAGSTFRPSSTLIQYLESMDVRLRPWTLQDVDRLALIANNRAVWNNVRDRLPQPYTREDAESWIGKAINKRPAQYFAIEWEGQVVGNCGIEIMDDVYRRNAEIGYFVGEPWWGKGIASEAVRQLVDYIWHTFDVVRIVAEVFEFNKASMNVLEKNGFQLEAIRRQAVQKNGQMWDDYVFVKFRPGYDFHA